MNHVHGTFDPELVLFSYGVAVLASYTVLDLVDRLSLSKGWFRQLWLLFGGAAMGIGIWSMHFVGMLAMTLPMEVGYDLGRVLFSVWAAIISSAAALHLVGREKVGFWRWIGGGLLLAAGVVAMHYIGMSAMLVHITYNYKLVLLSVLIAVAASLTAFALSFYFRRKAPGRALWSKIGSGLLMGAAIAGMHYTGMWGASFSDMSSASAADGIVLNHRWLAYTIVIGTMLTLGLSLAGLLIARRFERQQNLMIENEKMFRSLYENNQDGIITVDLQQRIIGINAAAAGIFQVEEIRFYNKPLYDLLTGTLNEEDVEYVLDSLSQKSNSYDMTFILAGTAADLHLMTVPLEVDDKLVGHYLIIRDITDEKRTRERIHYLAFHDELTGLDNRRRFNQRLQEMIMDHNRSGSRFAVMVMDMDRFKSINDSLGHMYGDLFLRQMSQRIREITDGRSISLARIGGDEITVLYANSDADMAAELAGKFTQAIQKPFRLKNNDFFVTASVGIAMFPDHGQDEELLVKHADAAMYEVKNNGKNGYCFFTEELDEKLQSKVKLENDLRKALNQNEFVLYYQPQIQPEDRRMVGVEALVRWNHPERGIVGPDQFISAAEELGLIIELGNWVLSEACRQMKEWHDNGGPLISVAVNLSSQQFHQTNLVAYISQVLNETGLAAKYLELEITESMMMDPAASISVLQELSRLGVRISLDDFGTGYSSLSYLKMFPIHKLKIDRSFVRDIVTNKSDQAIVSTIISMARHLDLNVIAEGIETKEQLEAITDTDCREIQGFYYSKPLSAKDVEESFFIPQRIAFEQK
ncbi:bifunctional diguanylate cyclase/phosphodiesterase [Paenibacillus pinistramenti]|uniref:bifunctional diguanylate cyclase/phosphodiesterase n=1 Tax=Paenibacillus pinistramenti TaxID=1768003 RepID=UPI001107F808|nr:bifunctional diguanylate cyclase/phosphodiesterase [Paenibacillus pinistramenti]